MSSRSDALYSAVLADVHSYTVGPDFRSIANCPDAPYTAFASQVLLTSLLKKWQGTNTSANEVALRKFLAANQRCLDWIPVYEVGYEEVLLNEMRKILDDFFHPQGAMLWSSYWDILDKAYTGPGASIGCMGHTSFYAKMYSSPLTTTSDDLYTSYRNYLIGHPGLMDAEELRISKFGECRVVDGSSISFAPKTVAESRLICTEPLLNSYFQLGIGSLITERLRSFFGIDLERQPEVNQQLARIGSVSGRLATIDLSSASDSVSLLLCKLLLPDWVYDTLIEVRSPYCRTPMGRVRLAMMSTMGNGFTFPLQTLIFASAILASYRLLGLKQPRADDRLNTNWGCFGDDLIVDSDSFRIVRRLLEFLGFVLNPAKTFYDGRFRESCGADWLHGQPVRGVYIKALTTPQDLYVAINLLNEWTARTGIGLPNAVSLLWSWIPPHKRFLVPFEENNDSGVRVSSRWLPKIVRDSNLAIVYTRAMVKPRMIKVTEEGFRLPRGVRTLSWNPHGLLQAFLHGTIRDSAINIRQKDVGRYFPKRACTPRWDYMPRGSKSNGSLLSWERWETALGINMPTPRR